MTEKQKLHHYIGIEMNRQSWILLGREDRNKQDNTRMVNFAKISLYHWQKSPKYKPINEQRGTWLISHVYAVMGDGRSALDYAKETWRLTEKYKFKDFDLAYANEAMARAYASLKNIDACSEWKKQAEKTGRLIAEVEDKKYFYEDFIAEPWFGCK